MWLWIKTNKERFPKSIFGKKEKYVKGVLKLCKKKGVFRVSLDALIGAV